MNDKAKQPETLDLQTLDVAADKKAQLRQLFPSVFAEIRNEQGKLVESIDFEKLKAELGSFSDLFESRRERYGMDWPGKKECLRIIQQSSVATLKPCRKESVDFDHTGNLFIEGDNLEVLKLLQKSYYGKVKMIYIDPPYNTGKEFIYPDNYSESLETYLAYAGLVDDEGRRFSTNTPNEGRFHTKWLDMMYPRLYLARNLLREDGVIFISIDDNEISNLKALICDIYGEDNILGIIANINNPKGRSDDKFVATAHEYILIVAKNITQASLYGFEPEDNIIRRYNKQDQNRKNYREIDLRKTGDEDRRKDRPDMFYYFYYNKYNNTLRVSKENNKNGNEIEIIPLREDGVEGRWRWGFDTACENIHTLIPKYMPNRKIWGVFEIDYLENRQPVKPTSAWAFKDVNSERGSEQFIELGFSKEVFPRPKPVGTMKRVLEIGTFPNEHSIVLDFFAGSCSFAHAVFSLLKEGSRALSFIVIQLPERLDPNNKEQKPGYDFCVEQGKPSIISEIGKERIRRVINNIKEEQAVVAKEAGRQLPGMEDEQPQLDLGFKAFKLDRSNFKVWDGSNTRLTEEELVVQLELHLDHINPSSTQEEILYELLLKAGFMLTEKVEKLELASKTVFSIAGGALLICLEDEITRELIDAVAEAEPQQFICLDEGFHGNDQLKANAVQTFTARNQGREQAEQIVFRTV